MSLNLGHIPCPAGNKCTAFKCIFGHESDQKQSEALKTDPPVSEVPASANQEGPRKRVKTDPESSTSTYVSDKPRPDALTDSLNRSTGAPQTANRPISPPPLRRPASKPGQTSSPRPAPPATAATPLTRPSAAVSSESTKSAPTKKESLNPRLLRSSPASHEIRYRLLKLLHAEYSRLNSELKKDANEEESRLVLNDHELIARALDTEQKTATTKASVYSSVMKHKIMHYKRLKVGEWKVEREKEVPSTSKKLLETLDGPKKIETDLTPAEEVKMLRHLLTPIDKLSKHGYVAEVPSEEAIARAKDGQNASQGWEKCDRCQQRFQVFPGRRDEDGALTSGGTCTFHWGKSYVPTKAPGETTWRQKRYLCCGEDIGQSPGCYTRDHHVYKSSNTNVLASVLNYAETPANPSIPSDRAVAFDCEMGYTVFGLEIIRLTAVSWPSGEELLDILVHPLGEILDLNSRFSGVWPEDLARAKPWSDATKVQTVKSGLESGSEDGEVRKKELPVVSSPEVARDLLFSLISPSTPLIGHGLENDLNAIRVVHPSLIDTVLLYPHKAGLPYRNGLKMLMNTQLGVKIQQETGSKVVGHDSAEDARAAGQLVRLKVMEEWKRLKLAGWKVEKGGFVPPE